MAVSSNFMPVTKLVGRENFSNWKFAMQAYLQLEDLWECVLGTEKDEQKITKAKSRIILAVDPINYVHIQNATTAKQAWEKLGAAFEDSGLTRKVGLLRTLVTTQLENCSNVEDYVNKIITTANKLNSMDFEVKDEWVGTLLLAGLPEQYKPMIMGLESSGTRITGDFIKTKLLQDIPSKPLVKNSEEDTALVTWNINKPHFRCYNCNKIGHISRQCRLEQRKKLQPQYENEKKTAFISVFTVGESNKSAWYLDSCASSHMTMHKDWLLKDVREYATDIYTAGGERLKSQLIGTSKIKIAVGNLNDEVEAREVLYVPNISSNLLSISKLVKKGNTVQFYQSGCRIINQDGIIFATAREINGIYKINEPIESSHITQEIDKGELWHRRLGHMSEGKMNQLRNISDTKLDYTNINAHNCTSCVMGKQHREPFKSSNNRAENILHLVHTDLCGPMEVESLGGCRYFLTMIDDYSKKLFVYFLKEKSQVFECMKEFKVLVENQQDKKIKIFRSDNGGEYVNHQIIKYLKESGTKHQLTVRYTPQQNGVAERMNRTIVEKARSMLWDANLPKQFWAEAVNTAAYLINRTPAASVDGQLPEEIWTKRRVEISHLRIFGCKAMVHIPKEKRVKWDYKSEPMIFVGYSENTKGYRFINPKNNKLVISRDVKFFENETLTNPYSETNGENVSEICLLPIEISKEEREEEVIESEEEIATDLSESNRTSSSETSSILEYPSESQSRAIEIRRSTRTPRPKVLNDFITYKAETDFVADPQNIEEAFGRSDASSWKQAMEEEYNALLENNTWTLVDAAPNKKVLSTRWVFKTKSVEDIEKPKYKARLVVRGCAQTKGIDYEEIYSPVVRINAVRLLLSWAVKEDLEIHHMDVKNAFLQGELHDEIYICQPEGFELSGSESKVCKLNKAMYGLKQGSKQWNRKIDMTLKLMKFQQSKTEQCIYYIIADGKIQIIAVYVDDIIILSNDIHLMQETKDTLLKTFKMKDLGEINKCLGMRITRDRKAGKIWIDQSEYIESIIERFNMSDSNEVKTPLDSNQKLTDKMSPNEESDQLKMKNTPYKEAVGSLLYAAQISRPDITYAVGVLSRFSSNPGQAHWIAVKRVLRYLKGTVHHKLQYDKDSKSTIEAYSDADWANCSDNRRSVTGYIIIMQGGPISWTSKRQRTVALSTTEAEYMALSSVCQEVLWLRSLASEIGISSAYQPTIVYCDNKGAVDLALTEGYRQRRKHIDIRYHFLRQHIENKDIEVKFVHTGEMLADFLTKALPIQKFNYCIQNCQIVLT